MMKTLVIAAAVICTALVLKNPSHADERGKLIFSDDFERNESQEARDEVGNGWGTNSKSRAGGNKQVDLRDGALYISMHKTADHAVSVRHDAAFTNGEVEMRFMLEDAKDTLGLDFADADLKTVHAGHLFKVTVGKGKLVIMDSKTGKMNLEIRKARQAGTVTPEVQKLLKTKSKVFPAKLKTGQWYKLVVKIKGDEVEVTIDGKPAGTFRSEGFAHPTKKMLRLSVPKAAVIDDVKIFAANSN